MFFRGSTTAAPAAAALARRFSSTSTTWRRRRSTSKSKKKIPSPKVPEEEANAISEDLLKIVKNRGPLSVPNLWDHAKVAGIDGLASKTHMKIMLKWMMGKRMLQLFCTRAGNSKKFLLSTLPEDTKTQPKSRDSVEPPGRHDFDTTINQYLENSWKMKV